MKKSLVFHINGPETKNCGIYITDAEKTSQRKWSELGLVQNVHFEVNVDEPVPRLSMGFCGLVSRSINEPDLSDGIVILWKDALIIDEQTSIPTNANILIFQVRPEEEQRPDNPFFKNVRALGCVQSLVLDANVATRKVTLEIEGIKSNWFGTRLVQASGEWMSELPDWVTVKYKNLDILKEIGTDGVIDSISDNLKDR